MKFTSEKSKKSVNFLNVIVSLINQYHETDLYCKPTDFHQFLEFNSAHPIHIKKNQLCIVKICGMKDYVPSISK